MAACKLYSLSLNVQSLQSAKSHVFVGSCPLRALFRRNSIRVQGTRDPRRSYKIQDVARSWRNEIAELFVRRTQLAGKRQERFLLLLWQLDSWQEKFL